MDSRKKQARLTGALYLVLALVGGFGILYVPGQLVEPGNAVQTATNIRENEFLFRLGIASQLVCSVLFVFLGLALYRLLRRIHRRRARLMVILVLVSAPIGFLITLPQIAALNLLRGANYARVFEPEQVLGQMLLLLELHQIGILVVGIFWGLWLFPFGYLVYHSGFIPKLIGLLLMIGCVAYLIESFGWLLFPEFHSIISPYLLLPLSLGEFSIIVWLVTVGARDRSVDSLSFVGRFRRNPSSNPA